MVVPSNRGAAAGGGVQEGAKCLDPRMRIVASLQLCWNSFPQPESPPLNCTTLSFPLAVPRWRAFKSNFWRLCLLYDALFDIPRAPYRNRNSSSLPSRL